MANVAALAMNAAGADETAKQERADRGADHDGQVLHGVQQGVGGTDSRLAHQPR